MMRHGWRETWRARRADVAVVACIVGYFVLFFPQVIFGDRFIIAGDALYYSYPLRTVAWNMIRHGQLPLWTPYVLSGYPLLSMAQVAVGYPLTWTYLLLPGYWAEQVYVLAPFLLAPIFTYAYARQLERSRLAALLAGLAFGYGGMMCSFIANSGMLTNGLMWAPLVLLFIDRARTRPFTHCLLWATGTYTLAVLAGHGQSFTYVGLLALGYGLFLALVPVAPPLSPKPLAWAAWPRWRPLATAAGALCLAAGVAAFQLLEALAAARHSIRSALSYETFGEGSFAPRAALLSLGAPLYHYVDTGTYVAPLALLLAAAALVGAWRMGDARVWFWVGVAALAWLLLLGIHTPLYRLAYHVPVLNQFRVPSRHTFEWTLAVSLLAAYGWDAVVPRLARRRAPATAARRRDVFIVCLLSLAAGVTGALWWRATSAPPVPNPTIYTGLPETTYWLWKLLFTALVCALVWRGGRLSAPRWRTGTLAAAVCLACFVEPAVTVSCWWGRLLSLPAARLQQVSPTTRYLQQLPPTENRVYTRVGLFAEEFVPHPRLEAPNLPAVYGLHNVAGMEPLLFDRYSRALGGVGPDSVTPRPGFPATNADLLGAGSHVLDLLNTTHLVTFANLKPFEYPTVERDGIRLFDFELDLSLPPGATARLTGAAGPGDTLALVTSLANSVNVAQDETVARVRVYLSDGRTIERAVRAGRDTAEWAHERADVRPIIKHQLASVFDSPASATPQDFANYRYWTRVPLGAPAPVARIEVTNVTAAAPLAIWRATLYDSTTGRSAPLIHDLRSEFWQTVYAADGVLILHNLRALPRAWLVAEATAVSDSEALRLIRGASAATFDPRRTALLELPPGTDLPALPGGALAPASVARIETYEPNRLVLTTQAPTASVLVVSELYYPGWVATVDGQPAQLLRTDYLLRGLALPAGAHTIEMHYTAPAARTGALISGLTLTLLGGLVLYNRRRRG